MDSRIIDTICKAVYARFPEVKGARPSVQNLTKTQVLLIFKASVKTANGSAMQRIVRVTASKDGRISKMTTSR